MICLSSSAHRHVHYKFIQRLSVCAGAAIISINGIDTTSLGMHDIQRIFREQNKVGRGRQAVALRGRQAVALSTKKADRR